MIESFDVFLSYSRRDAGEWTRILAENLERLGIRVWWDGWEVRPGDVLIHELDRGLKDSLNGILVVSPAALESPWVQQEYAALMQRAIEGRRRLVPVLYDDAELPPFLASRVWVDFRDVDGPEYEARVRELAKLLREVRPSRPPRSEELAPPPASTYRAERPMRRRLVIGREEVRLEGGPEVASGRPSGTDAAAEEVLWQLQREQRCAAMLLRAPTAEALPAESHLHHRLLEAGAALGRCWLPAAVGLALTAAVAEAERLGARLELALDIADPELSRLPWETLRPPDAAGQPGEPLVLRPHVDAYRVVGEGEGPKTAIQVPPPLRVLVAIGSPEVDAASGELLDYEAELSLILDAVEPARAGDRGAYVRLLRRGTPKAIREALQQQRFHVLYISCHAGPGVLRLEDDEGNEEQVDAERLVDEVLPPGRRPPLVVLAGCATGVGHRKAAEAVLGEEAGEVGEGFDRGEKAGAAEEARQEAAVTATGARHLPGLAEALLARGVPAVVAMQAPVGDLYARELGARLFAALATHESPDPLSALSAARRAVEEMRLQNELDDRGLAEWATPALYLPSRPPATAPTLPLFPAGAAREAIEEPPEPRLAEGTMLRGVGDFVGRRREERLALRALRHDGRGGVLLQGLGGVGKSTLAAALTRHLAEDGWLLSSVVGRASPDDLLAAVAATLRRDALQRMLKADDPQRELARTLNRRDVDWEERFDLLSGSLFASRPLLLLLDNFEDNLDSTGPPWLPWNADLAALLARWLRGPGKSRLLVTARHPFALPQDAEGRLETLPLGPLSFAETRKLLWRLPALHALPADEKLSAYTAVGGHPRTLEYLDALLNGGEARYKDVEEKIAKTLAERGVDDPRRWLARFRGALDASLAEGVTLAADDVLLHDLLRRVEQVPLARRLLIGASVYRQPIDEVGLAWQVGEIVEPTAHPARDARLAEAESRWVEAMRRERGTSFEELGYAEAESQQLAADLAARHRPPLSVPMEFAPAVRRLLDLGLLSPAGTAEGTGSPLFMVHRWTAKALALVASSEELRDAHRRAAVFWRWSIELQSRTEGLKRALEVRQHYHEAGDLDEAVEATHWISGQLEIPGAYREAEQLCREALSWIEGGSIGASILIHALGNLALMQGFSDTARTFYLESLSISEERDFSAGKAACCHQLGAVAQGKGDYDEALTWYRQALAINEKLGNGAAIAGSYLQIGYIAEQREEFQSALEWYLRALDLSEGIGDERQMARSYHHLGVVNHELGRHEPALNWYRKALKINEELGDRVGIASSYHQLGRLAQDRAAYEEALVWYRRSLEIDEDIGNRLGLTISYFQLGRLSEDRGDLEDAEVWFMKSLQISQELGSPAWMAKSQFQLGRIAQARKNSTEAIGWFRKSLEIEEKLGHRREVASSLSALAMLWAESGDQEKSISITLRSLMLRLELRVPEVADNLHWLSRQRDVLGEQRFRRILDQEAGEAAPEVVEFLDQFAAASAGAAPTSSAPPPAAPSHPGRG